MKLALTPTLLFTTIATLLLGYSLWQLDPGYMSLWQATFTFLGLMTLVFALQQMANWAGRKSVVSLLAIALAIGGGAAAVSGWQEYIDHLHQSDFYRQQINGFIGQANLYASLVLLGWLAAIYLLCHIPFRWVRYITLFAAHILYCAPLPFTGSRTMLISMLALSLLSLAGWFMFRLQETKRMAGTVLLAMLLGLAAQVSLPEVASKLTGISNRSTLNRIEAAGMTGSKRLRTDEWRKSVLVWEAHPVGGAGVGRYAYESFQLQQRPPFNEVQREQVYDHSHNLFTQLAAETGSVGLALTCTLFLIWLWQQRATEKNAATLFCWSGILVLFIHSNLEYPLWYWYFLISFTIMLAMTDEAIAYIRVNTAMISLLFLACLGGTGWAVYTTYIGASQVEEGYALSDDQPKKAMAIGEQAARNPFVAIEADQMVSYLENVEPVNLGYKLARNTRLLHWRPYASVVYHRALLMAQLGKMDEAKKWLLAGLKVYPSKRVDYFDPLLDDSVQNANLKALRAFYKQALQAMAAPKTAAH